MADAHRRNREGHMIEGTRRRAVAAAVVAVTLGIAVAGQVSAAPGQPVQQFGDDGIATIGGRPGPYRASVVQADGKIVTVIFEDGASVIVRLTASGDLDPTFSRDGRVPIDPSFGTVSALALDGKKVVIAAITDSGVAGRVASIGRLTGSGAWDRSFDGDGRLVLDTPGQITNLAAVAIGPGRTIVLLTSYALAGTSSLLVQRLTADGALDKTFSRDGTARVPMPTGASSVAGTLDLAADGGIVVSSADITPTRIDTIVSRLTTGGKAVRGFGTNGWVRVSVDGRAYTDTYRVEFDDAGRIVGGGTSTPDGTNGFRMFAFRLTPVGSFDKRFAGDGTRTIALSSSDVAGGFLAQQDNGALVLAGLDRTGSIVVVRLTPRGAFDRSFSGDGRALVSTPSAGLNPLDIDLAPGQDRAYIMAAVGAPGSSQAGVVAVRLS
jgi:uncharacterized delta-60 repeat protein